MTLDTAHSREVYQGNSSATTFPFFFTVWDAAQVAVTVTDAAGASADVTAQCAITLADNGGPLPARKRPTARRLEAGHHPQHALYPGR